MKNANDVLRQKEADLARVRHEIDTLKIVAPLLAENDSDVEGVNLTSDGPGGKPSASADDTIDAPAEATGTNGLFSSFSHQRPKLWNALKRHS